MEPFKYNVMPPESVFPYPCIVQNQSVRVRVGTFLNQKMIGLVLKVMVRISSAGGGRFSVTACNGGGRALCNVLY